MNSRCPLVTPYDPSERHSMSVVLVWVAVKLIGVSLDQVHVKVKSVRHSKQVSGERSHLSQILLNIMSEISFSKRSLL